MSGSPASRSDSIPSFCFRFSDIAPGFDPFILFRVLRHHARIRSLCFVLGSSASRPDYIPSFCFGFSGIMLGFNPFVLFQVLRHRAQIRSFFISGSPTSCPDSIIFSGIMSGFSSSSSASCLSIAYLFWHCVQASLIFSGIVSDFHYLFWHHVQIFLIFLGIVSKHRLSFPASWPTFIIFSCIVIGFFSFYSTSCPSIAYPFRHRIRLSPIFPSIVSGSLIFPGIVLGSLLVLQL